MKKHIWLTSLVVLLALAVIGCVEWSRATADAALGATIPARMRSALLC